MNDDRGGILLADSGETPCMIVVPEVASPGERHAAEELREHLVEATGADFRIVEEGRAADGGAILVGWTRRTAELLPDVVPDDLGLEEFLVRTIGDDLLIVGGEPRGTLYGVYEFLESVVGCRWFTRTITRIPRTDRLVIPPMDLRKRPVLEYREVFYKEAFDGDWAARHRLNSSHGHLEERHGGKVRYGKGTFVHTFDRLVPVAEHFDEHPEWFSEVDGVRVSERTQLCLTNPEVLDLALEGVLKWIADEPDATIFSVSQTDWRNPCQCANCAAVDAEEGSHAGTLLRFVNRVAEAVERVAPHVAIDTLAYLYTRNPPKYVRPRPNVIVRLCSIECCFSHPLETCPESASFVSDLTGWSAISDRLYVWNYVTCFKHYIMPWPNLRALGPDVRLYARNSVVGLFEQGNSAGGGEMAELRAYMIAKLLWNPDCDERAVMNEFIDAVYGPAAPHIREYVEIVHGVTEDPDCHLYTTVARIPADYISPCWTDDVLDRADAALDNAEQACDTEELLERIRTVRMPVDYLRIRRTPDGPERDELVDALVRKARRDGTGSIAEGHKIDDWVARGAHEVPVPRAVPADSDG